MNNESTGISNLGSHLPDTHKPLSTQRQQSSTNTDTALPVNKSHALATPLLQQPLAPVTTPKIAGSLAVNESKTEADQQAPTENKALSVNELREMLDEINGALYSMNKSLKFEVHDKTNDLIVRVINTRTDEVIRQYPSEEVLERKERLLVGETSAFSARVD